jgi:hypothetical protein
VTASAAAGGRVTRAGSWYRQLNSNTSEDSSASTPVAKNSRQASAVARWAGLALRRSAVRLPASPASTVNANSGPGV